MLSRREFRGRTAGAVRVRWARTRWAPGLGVWGGIVLNACVIDLPPLTDDAPSVTTPTIPNPEMEPVPEPDGGPGPQPEPGVNPTGGSGGTPDVPSADASSMAGTGGGGAAGGTFTGGAGQGPMPDPCSPSERECGGECIPMDQPCCPDGCDVFDHATGRCEQDVCVLDECFDGFIDCDGEPDNGCEVDFNFEPISGNTLVAPRIDSAVADPWENVSLVPLDEPCDCTQSDSRVPQPDPIYRMPPAPQDLRAGFALGWDDAFLHLRVQVFDDEVPPAGTAGDARNRDNIEFVFDGDPGLQDGQDDQHAFFAFDEGTADLNSNVSLDRVVDVEVDSVGQCHFMTAHLSTAFLSGLRDGGSEPTIQLVAAAVLSFDVAVNDYDFSVAGDTSSDVEQQGHLFFRDPGNNYWFGQRTLPRVELVAAP